MSRSITSITFGIEGTPDDFDLEIEHTNTYACAVAFEALAYWTQRMSIRHPNGALVFTINRKED